MASLDDDAVRAPGPRLGVRAARRGRRQRRRPAPPPPHADQRGGRARGAARPGRRPPPRHRAADARGDRGRRGLGARRGVGRADAPLGAALRPDRPAVRERARSAPSACSTIDPDRCLVLSNGFDPDDFRRRTVDRAAHWRRHLVDEPQGWRPGGSRAASPTAPRTVERPRRRDRPPQRRAVHRRQAHAAADRGVRRARRSASSAPRRSSSSAGIPASGRTSTRPRPSTRLGAANVFLAGWHEHDELPAFMNASDALALASVREQFGQVLVEAMACAPAADRRRPVRPRGDRHRRRDRLAGRARRPRRRSPTRSSRRSTTPTERVPAGPRRPARRRRALLVARAGRAARPRALDDVAAAHCHAQRSPQQRRERLPVGLLVAAEDEPPHLRAPQRRAAAPRAHQRPSPPCRRRRASPAGARTPSPGRRRARRRTRGTARPPRRRATAAPAAARAPATARPITRCASGCGDGSTRSRKPSRSYSSFGWNSIRSSVRTWPGGSDSASRRVDPDAQRERVQVAAAVEQRRVLGEQPHAVGLQRAHGQRRLPPARRQHHRHRPRRRRPARARAAAAARARRGARRTARAGRGRRPRGRGGRPRR